MGMIALPGAPIAIVPGIPGMSPPWTPQAPGVIFITLWLLFLPEVKILDYEIGIVILKLPESHDLLTLHNAGNGHPSPLTVDLAV